MMAENAASSFSWVNVEDVAEAHVQVLGLSVSKNCSYLLAGPNSSWDDVLDILKEDYPHLPYKLEAGAGRAGWVTDTSKAEKELGLKWRSLRETVHELVDQQLGLM